MSDAFEHTVVFLFFLLVFVIGALMAAKFIGTYIRPVSSSLADAVQST